MRHRKRPVPGFRGRWARDAGCSPFRANLLYLLSQPRHVAGKQTVQKGHPDMIHPRSRRLHTARRHPASTQIEAANPPRRPRRAQRIREEHETPPSPSPHALSQS
mmetsp:Transcript_69797/g.191510  ORF Transcript_69797/g.191510 Transcript_69797/m.191510 type:complete len:105 (+) Transcript_69797:142-456(+)